MYTLEELHQTIVSAITEALEAKKEPEFAHGNVPIPLVAKIYGKDIPWVRAGIIVGWLPIGIAIRNGHPVTRIEDMDSKFGKITYQVNPKKLWEDTGYVWKGEETLRKDF